MGHQPIVFTRTYDETLDMIVEARNYISYMSPAQWRRERGMPDLRFSCEALRVTSRLTQVMAWLMMQRAVHNGEITVEDACHEDNRLSGQDVCLNCTANGDSTLPEGLRSLLDRSLRLYERVSRLEQQVLTRVVN
jgi:regulator of CtrA degradation